MPEQKKYHFTFSKFDRLSSKKLIDRLFEKGKSFQAGGLRIFYYEEKLETGFPVQSLISVSKRKFKRATDRNRIKRLIRENLRLNKKVLYEFLETENKQFLIGIVFTQNKIPDFSAIQTDILQSFDLLKAKLKK